MAKLSDYRVLIAGILSPVGAVAPLWCVVAYAALMPGTDPLSRGRLFGIFSGGPRDAPAFSGHCSSRDKKTTDGARSQWGKIGLAVAVLSLGLTFNPVQGVIDSWKQPRNMAMGTFLPLASTHWIWTGRIRAWTIRKARLF